MTIAKAMKKFFLKLNGAEPVGMTIADVISNGADSVSLNNEALAVSYEDSTRKSFVLKSSTTDSVKEFSVTVTDDGTLAATEITE